MCILYNEDIKIYLVYVGTWSLRLNFAGLYVKRKASALRTWCSLYSSITLCKHTKFRNMWITSYLELSFFLQVQLKSLFGNHRRFSIIAVLQLCRPDLGYLFFLYQDTFLGPLSSLWTCLDTEHSQVWSAGRCRFWKPHQLLKDGEVNRWQHKTLRTAFDSSCFCVI